MYEVTFFENGLEVGTFDYPDAPAVGTDYGDCIVTQVIDLDADAMTATVEIEYL